MHQIRPNIWLGDGEAVRAEPVPMKAKGITAVLNVASDVPTRTDALYNFLCCHVPLKDDTTTNPRWLIEHAVLTLRTLLQNGHTVYVHCRCGINRSPTIIALYIAATEYKSFAEAWEEIRRIRPQIHSTTKVLPKGFY